jgi:hypothetical protein
MMFGFAKKKTVFPFGKKLNQLIIEAKRSGVPEGDIAYELSAYIGSVEQQTLMRQDQRRHGNGIFRSGNLPE